MSTQQPSGNANTTNPLASLLGSGSQRTDMTWDNLTSHERADAWGSINDVYMQILGRQATMAEAKQYYNEGISNYALGQTLMMTKEFLHTSIFKQLEQGYNYELAQFVGHGFTVKPKLMQAWAAHNYTTTDIQSWVYSHPHVYEHSNDFQTRVSQMKQVYQSVFGIDPWAAENQGTHQQLTLAKMQPPTNSKKGVPAPPPPPGSGLVVGPDGQWYHAKDVANDPLLAHIHQAAMSFQTPDQYKAWLMNTPLYKQQAQAKLAPGPIGDASLTLDSRSRPIMQGLNPLSRVAGGSSSTGTSADVAQ